MTYRTLSKRINAATARMNQATLGKHDYTQAIEALSATEQVCKYTIIFLKKCEADNIPFDEYAILLKGEVE